MSQVTGSKQYRSVVVQERPGQRLQLILGSLLLLLAIALSAYWVGGRSLHTDNRQMLRELTQTKQQLAELDTLYANSSQQLTNFKVGSDIDRKASEAIRGVVREHKQTINQLNKEIDFYKGLMSPTERERGLGIRSWELYPGSAENRFQFKLVFQQLALKHGMLKGSVVVNIIGKRDGVEEQLPLKILSEQIDDKGVKLRFKYFQYVDGELVIPVGFSPVRVEIIAKATAPKAVIVEKQYGWIVQKL